MSRGRSAARSELSRTACAARRVRSCACLRRRYGLPQRCGGPVSARQRLAVWRVLVETGPGAAHGFCARLSIGSSATWRCVFSASARIDVLDCALRPRVASAMCADACDTDACTSSRAGVGNRARGTHRRCIVERRQDSRSATRRLLSSGQDVG